MIREEYSRAHRKSIGNELYGAMTDLKSIFQSLNSGTDFHVEEIDAVIEKLEHVKRTAQKFDSGTIPIDPNYR
jgi:hypothetical protein